MSSTFACDASEVRQTNHRGASRRGPEGTGKWVARLRRSEVASCSLGRIMGGQTAIMGTVGGVLDDRCSREDVQDLPSPLPTPSRPGAELPVTVALPLSPDEESPAPLLSVTVTNYNYGRFLAQNIESVLAQSFSDFELILIDNASNDDSLEIMERYASSDPRIRVVAHRNNEGMYASLRESCELARGRYRVHVNADDWILSPDAFRLQIELLEAHPTMSLAYSSLTLVDTDGTPVTVAHPFSTDAVVPSVAAIESLLSFRLADTGTMFRLDLFRATDGYAEELPHIADQLLAVRLSEQGELVGYLDRSLYAFRQHGDNLNLRPELDIVRSEYLPALEEAFSGRIGSQLPRRVKRRMRRNVLLHLPTQCIFNSRLRLGWRLYWESFRACPLDTLFQRRTVALVARTLLGKYRFDRLSLRLRGTAAGATRETSRAQAT